MVSYLDSITTLMDEVSAVTDGLVEYSRWPIMEEYKQHKQKIKEDAHGVQLTANDAFQAKDVGNAYYWSVVEAAAYGYSAPANSRIDFKLFCALEEAHSRLTSVWSCEEWAGRAQE